MNLRARVSLLSGIAHLAVGFIVLLRRTRSPLTVPLVLLCLDLFGWNFASLAYQLSGKSIYHRIDVSLSPFTAALGLHVIVAFVGRVRELRLLLAANYALFTAMVVLHGDRPMGLPFLLALVPMSVVAMVLLVQHLRGNVDRVERARTWAIIVAFVIGAATGPVEFFDQHVQFPIGAVGLLVTTSLVAFVTVRYRLLGRPTEPSAVARAVVIAAGCSLLCIAAYRELGGEMPVVVLASSVVAIALAFALREALFGYADERARREQLAMLGRLSSQLAHDLENPLSSIKGALQFLAAEPDDKRLAEHREFLALMLDQVHRMHRVIGDYQRIGRVEPARESVDINALVEGVVALHRVGGAIEVRTELAPERPRLAADPDLLATALENLVRNALEAMPRGGVVTLKTARTRESIVISVADTGEGMDPRQRASAFDEFFTTKATGSGLGLAFVRRVVEAHDGSVLIESTLGRGTTVRLELPG